MRRQLRRAALTTLKACGAFGVVRESAWRRQRLLILCYHGVALDDEDQWRPHLYVSPETLERRLDILQRGKYSVLPLVEALDRLRRNDLPPRSIALTFDDGTYDFYSIAFPALRQRKLPVTVYLTTYYSEAQLPVFNLICSYMLWRARSRGSLDLSEFGVAQPVALDSSESRETAVNEVMQWTEREGFSGQQKDEVAGRIAGRLHIDYEDLRRRRVLQLMNREEVSQLAAEGVDFQLHTHRHRTPQDEDLFRREIRDNRAHIAGMLSGERKHFCYPSGAWRPEFVGWLQKEGVISATTCDTGFATAESNPLLLPRFVDTSARTDLEFESWLDGVGHFLSRRRRARLAYPPD
jgi:peptidoglycan/xylan/chitin deacetylase (PgdA/CDA1 family)